MDKTEQIRFINNNFKLYRTCNAKRNIRHDFFSRIDTELQAYLLGFYASDGNINMKRKTLRIHVSEKDSEIINIFKNIIGPDSRVFRLSSHYTTGREHKTILANNSIGIDINSTILVSDLIKLGFGCNKTYQNLNLPKLSNELLRHFIRGYFDGDGCITGWVTNDKFKRFRYSFDICSKTKSILEDIQNYFNKHDININLNYIKRDSMYRLKTSSRKELFKIYNLLYKDSNFYLSRKFNKFTYYVNTDVNQLLIDHCNAQDIVPRV